MIPAEVICRSCIHYDLESDSCAAYPDGLPYKMLFRGKPPEKCGDFKYELAPIPDKFPAVYPFGWLNELGIDTSKFDDPRAKAAHDSYIKKRERNK